VRSGGSETVRRAHHPAGLPVLVWCRSSTQRQVDSRLGEPHLGTRSRPLRGRCAHRAYVGRGSAEQPKIRCVLTGLRQIASGRGAALSRQGRWRRSRAPSARCAARDRSVNAALQRCHVPIWSAEKRLRGVHHEMRSHPMAASLSFRPSETPSRRNAFAAQFLAAPSFADPYAAATFAAATFAALRSATFAVPLSQSSRSSPSPCIPLPPLAAHR
jgi:hypothetical protein